MGLLDSLKSGGEKHDQPAITGEEISAEHSLPDVEPDAMPPFSVDAATGNVAWRKYVVPAPGEPGSETRKDKNNAWQTGGGAMWVTGSYDVATNQVLWGTGNPVPMFDPYYRPGDNLYTNSLISWDPDSGKMNWYHQFTPGDRAEGDRVSGSWIMTSPPSCHTTPRRVESEATPAGPERPDFVCRLGGDCTCGEAIVAGIRNPSHFRPPALQKRLQP
jgi:hypothetical protein